MIPDDPTSAALPVAFILRFWFKEHGQRHWFGGGPKFDQVCAEAMGHLVPMALDGDFDPQADDGPSTLALILLLDQVPRNIYRHTARAFAGDARARAHCRRALREGWDQALGEPAQRLFVYLPLEHSEDLGDQEEAVRLISALGVDDWTDYAVRHRDVIARFGRFPHRNRWLERDSTPEELAFLEQPGSRF